MGDPQEVKSRGQYNHWSEPEKKMLLRLLVDAVNQGLRDASGKFNKLTMEDGVLSYLNQKLGSTKTYKQYRNRMRILTAKYRSLADLLCFSYGFGWDHETKKFTAYDEVWNEYLKAHPSNRYLRDESFVGLGDTIDKQTYQVGDTEGANSTSFVQMMKDVEGLFYQQANEDQVFSSSEKCKGEKLFQRKKARTDSKACDELNSVTEISSQIFGLIHKKWEKEAEEKEVEDKANNVWSAIKTIPDLDDDLWHEAMTLVHSLGMKYGFVNMSISDRCGWIKRNLRKPSG